MCLEGYQFDQTMSDPILRSRAWLGTLAPFLASSLKPHCLIPTAILRFDSSHSRYMIPIAMLHEV